MTYILDRNTRSKPLHLLVDNHDKKMIEHSISRFNLK